MTSVMLGFLSCDQLLQHMAGYWKQVYSKYTYKNVG